MTSPTLVPLTNTARDMQSREKLIALTGSIVPGLSSEKPYVWDNLSVMAYPLGLDLSYIPLLPGTPGGSCRFLLKANPSL